MPFNIQNFYIGAPAQNPNGLQLLSESSLVSGTSIDIQNLPYRRYLVIVLLLSGKALADTIGFRFNNDSGANYSRRQSANGAADATAVSQSGLVAGSISGTVGQIIILEGKNEAGVDKHFLFRTCGEITAAANAPSRTEGAGFWDNETNAIDRVTAYSVGGQNWGGQLMIFGAGS